jgi:DNA mismatch repair ATPase MutS
MTSGRLGEALARMSTLADLLRPHSLLLFNESFAGTNQREGSEIAQQVAHALLEAQVKVFFVSHRFDFARSFFESRATSTLFPRAGRLLDGQ